MNRTPLVALAATALFMAGLVPAGSTQQATHPERPPLRWFLTGRTLERIIDEPHVRATLAATQVFVLIDRTREAPRLRGVIPVASFASSRDIIHAVQRDALPDEAAGVVYDNETWRFTPKSEQRTPVASSAAAARVVHGEGLSFLVAPSPYLGGVVRPYTRDKVGAFVEAGVIGGMAEHADVVGIQAQGFERDSARYAAFVKVAAAQARRANPDVVVLAGLSTNPPGAGVTLDELLDAVVATREVADGYWLNVPEQGEYCPKCGAARTDLAAALFAALATDQ